MNAYHQPGVEAGKKAATAFLEQLARVEAALPCGADGIDIDTLATRLNFDSEDVFHMVNHLAANGRARLISSGESPSGDIFAVA